MKIGLLLLSAVGLALPGCQRDDTQIAEKLDQVIAKQDDILKALQSAPRGAAAAAGRGQPQRPARRRPEPNEVYAAPADGPYRGAKDAKVTIVKAFEFA